MISYKFYKYPYNFILFNCTIKSYIIISFSMSSNQFIGGICCYIFGCFLASAGGIGGGGVLVSIGLVVFDWGYTRSVVLALVAVFGNLLAQLSLNYNKRHMIVNTRPLIYWDVVRLLCPALLGGSCVGKIVEKILPTTVKESIAFIVLFSVTIKTFIKALHLYKLESINLSNQMIENSEKKIRLTDLMNTKTDSTHNSHGMNETVEQRISIAKMSFDGEGDVFIDTELKKLTHGNFEPDLIYPTDIIGVIVLVWICYAIIFVIIAVCTNRCTPVYWVLEMIVYPPLFAVTYTVSMYICIYI